MTFGAALIAASLAMMVCSESMIIIQDTKTPILQNIMLVEMASKVSKKHTYKCAIAQGLTIYQGSHS